MGILSLKYSTLAYFLYNLYLNYKCRKVKAYVFVATTGRSGTDSLCRFFNSFCNCKALHEPYPIMINDQRANVSLFNTNVLNKIKIVNIKRASLSFDYYIETNHQFIKRFSDIVVDEFKDKLKVIHLIRDPVDVALSFYSIGSVPGVTKSGNLYLLNPYNDDNFINYKELIQKDERFDQDLYRCLWYWYEIEKRLCCFQSKYPEIVCFRLRTEDLNDKQRLLEMLEFFNFYDLCDKEIKMYHSNRKIFLKKSYMKKPQDQGTKKEQLIEMNRRFQEAINEIDIVGC